jgi:hypothetical protein
MLISDTPRIKKAILQKALTHNNLLKYADRDQQWWMTSQMKVGVIVTKTLSGKKQ